MKSAAMTVDDTVLALVMQCWREVLGFRAVSEDSHFFLSGGDSLQLTRVLIRVRQQLQVELNLQDLVQFSTPRKMAAWCKRSGLTTAPAIAKLSDAPAFAIFAASQSQQGLWLSELRADNVGLYNSGLLLHLQGELNVSVLERALEQVLRQHPLLRGALQFDVRNKVLQVAIDEAALMTAITLPPVTATLSALAAMTAAFVAEPFVFDRMLLRFCLLQVSEAHTEHHVLLLACHHCIFDGWSGGVLLQSICTAYNALLRDSRWHCASIDTAYIAHCEREQSWLRSPQRQRDLQWWTQHLQGFSVAGTPTRWQGTAEQWPYHWQQRSFVLAPTLIHQLVGVSAAEGATLFSCLLLALQQTLGSVGGDRDYCIGYPVAGRSMLAEESSIGCYMSMLFTRVCVQEGADLRCVLRQIQADLTAAQAHALPLTTLVQQLRSALMPDGNHWFDVVLALQNFPLVKPRMQGLQSHCEAVPTAYGQYPLKFEVSLAAGAHRLEVSYAEAVVPMLLVERMAEEFVQALQCLVAALS